MPRRWTSGNVSTNFWNVSTFCRQARSALSIPPAVWRCWRPNFGRTAGCDRTGVGSVGKCCFQGRTAHCGRARVCKKSGRPGFSTRTQSILRKASIFQQRSPKKDVPRRRFSPNSCPEKLPQFTGPKICTGVSPRNGSSARSAGWSLCSTPKLFPWNLTASSRQ